MKWFVYAAATVVMVAGTSARAGSIEFRPVDTDKLVRQPSKVAANLAAGTINLVGQTAAGSIESNGYIKTFNNLFSFKRVIPSFQSGPSQLPSPNMYRSTQYRNYNTPVMPTFQQRR